MDASVSIRKLIPHAPAFGLYVAPDIPGRKLANARASYATGASKEEARALFDATLFGSARDGILFLPDRMVFRNNRMQAAQEVAYDDVTDIRSKRRMLGGKRLFLDVNRGHATITLEIDFSAKGAATEYVERLIRDLLMHGASAPDVKKTDVAAVRTRLQHLVDEGRLDPEDFDRMMQIIT